MRFSSSKGIDSDVVIVEVDDGSDETVDPIGVDWEVMTEDLDMPFVISASQINDPSLEGRLEVELPSLGEGGSSWCSFDPNGMASARSGDITFRTLFQAAKTPVLEASPDFGLPTAVETFDAGLESGLVGDSKDGSHAEAQTESNDATNGIRMLSGSCKAVVVVELGIAGQPDFAPVLLERFEDIVGTELSLRPGSREASMQGNSGKNRQMGPSTDCQTFDGIEAVQLAVSIGDLRDIPALGRRRAANTLSAIESAVPRQNAPDGSHRRQRVGVSLLEFSVNGTSTILAQCASFPESFASGQHLSFDGDAGAPGLLGNATTILPVDAIQSLSHGATDPMLNSRQGYTKGVSDGPQGRAISYFSNHPTPILC
jgi:hypothetical protein